MTKPKYNFPSEIRMDAIHIEKALRRDIKKFKKNNDLQYAVGLLILIALTAIFVHFVVDPMVNVPKAEAQGVAVNRDCSPTRKDHHDKACAEIAFQGFCKLAIANKLAIGETPDQKLLTMCNK